MSGGYGDDDFPLGVDTVLEIHKCLLHRNLDVPCAGVELVRENEFELFRTIDQVVFDFFDMFVK